MKQANIYENAIINALHDRFFGTLIVAPGLTIMRMLSFGLYVY